MTSSGHAVKHSAYQHALPHRHHKPADVDCKAVFMVVELSLMRTISWLQDFQSLLLSLSNAMLMAVF